MLPALKLLLMFLWLPLAIALALPFWALNWEGARRKMVRLSFAGMNAIFGVHVQLKGALAQQRPLILVSNHCSYLDILVLGSQLPIAFTPKKEIARWPIIGFCCRLAGCVFVERKAKAIGATKQEIAQKLQAGRVMCLFAEGTTNNGTDLKPFKSSFFGLAGEAQAGVQPAALYYSQINGVALDAAGRAKIAWYDDMQLLPHLWQLLAFRRIDACIELLEPLASSQDRKALCADAQGVIHSALEKAYEH